VASRSILLPDGNTTTERIYLHRSIKEDADITKCITKLPRGIMIKVDNESDWLSCQGCFSSTPITQPDVQ